MTLLRNPFRRRIDPHRLAARITGVKNGDRLAQIGCADGGRMAAIAAEAGTSGRALSIVPDGISAERARAGAATAGVAVVVELTPLTKLPAASAAFDVVVVDDTERLFESIRPERRRTMIGEIFRILRPGGYVVVIGLEPRGGMFGALLIRMQGLDTTFHRAKAFACEGFGPLRKLTEQDGLAFAKAAKPSEGAS